MFTDEVSGRLCSSVSKFSEYHRTRRVSVLLLTSRLAVKDVWLSADFYDSLLSETDDPTRSSVEIWT